MLIALGAGLSFLAASCVRFAAYGILGFGIGLEKRIQPKWLGLVLNILSIVLYMFVPLLAGFIAMAGILLAITWLAKLYA